MGATFTQSLSASVAEVTSTLCLRDTYDVVIVTLPVNGPFYEKFVRGAQATVGAYPYPSSVNVDSLFSLVAVRGFVYYEALCQMAVWSSGGYSLLLFSLYMDVYHTGIAWVSKVDADITCKAILTDYDRSVRDIADAFSILVDTLTTGSFLNYGTRNVGEAPLLDLWTTSVIPQMVPRVASGHMIVISKFNWPTIEDFFSSAPPTPPYIRRASYPIDPQNQYNRLEEWTILTAAVSTQAGMSETTLLRGYPQVTPLDGDYLNFSALRDVVVTWLGGEYYSDNLPTGNMVSVLSVPATTLIYNVATRSGAPGNYTYKVAALTFEASALTQIKTVQDDGGVSYSSGSTPSSAQLTVQFSAGELYLEVVPAPSTVSWSRRDVIMPYQPAPSFYIGITQKG